MKRTLLVACVVFFPLNALEIRKPEITEIAEVAHVYCRAWHDAFDKIVPSLMKYVAFKNCLNTWQNCYKKTHNTVFLVAYVDTQIVGLVYAKPYKGLLNAFGQPDCIIDKLYVLPEFKGQGVGKALLQATLAQLTQLNFHKAKLKSLTSNTAANGFYEHMGAILVDQSRFMHHQTMNIYEFDLLALEH